MPYKIQIRKTKKSKWYDLRLRSPYSKKLKKAKIYTRKITALNDKLNLQNIKRLSDKKYSPHNYRIVKVKRKLYKRKTKTKKEKKSKW